MAPVKCMVATSDSGCCQFKCCGSVVVESLIISGGGGCVGPCFVMQYLVTLLFLQSSILAEEGIESWLLFFNCLPAVL